jgi:TonB-dependent starch-binding outer membrane protein SusC
MHFTEKLRFCLVTAGIHPGHKRAQQKLVADPADRIKIQLFRAMRLTAFILLAACLQVAARGTAQTVTLSVKNASIQKVFREIMRQTGVSIVYNESTFNDFAPVTLNVKDAPIQQVLDRCFKDKTFHVTFENNIITIVNIYQKPADLPKDGENRPGTFKDTVKVDVHGKVTNELGEVLIGATVSIKNGKRGTLTDEKGQFYLKSVPVESTLQVTYTGYKRIEVQVEGDAPLVIKLSVATNGLDEAQVIAYGSTTERLGTGDVTTVKSAEIEKQPVSNVLAALDGRVPGLLITQNSGMPGSSYTVQIRGQNSIANGTDPFYVIDGVPYLSELLYNQNPDGGGNPFDFINPNDIESVSVLKDADATAIYGSRAANGAILITTKKGKAGKTRLDINLNQGVGRAPIKTHWMNTSQYLIMRREAIINDGDSLTDPSLNAPDLLLWDTTRYTNWQKLLIGNAAEYTDIQASLSGGNPNTQFLAGGDFHRESTVFPFSTAVPRGSIHVNLNNVSLDQKFRMSLTANYVVSTSHLPTGDLTGNINFAPNAPPLYNKDGTLNLSFTDWANRGNPLTLENTTYSSSINNLVGNLNLVYSLTKGLEVKTNLGYTNLQSHDISTNPIAAQDPAYQPTGSASYTFNTVTSWIAEPQVKYMIYTDVGTIEALVGSTFERNENNGLFLNGSGFTSDALIQDIQAAPVITGYGSTYSIYKYNALFARVSYNYLDKYLVNLTWRRDGSSRFGPANQLHDFASVGVGYIFSKENVFKERLAFLSFGKIRASYGTTGNDQVGDYQYLSLYQTTSTPYQNAQGLIPTVLSNPNLAWEETRKSEIGLDLGFFKDRVRAQVNYYLNRSSNQLVSTPLPGLTGFYSVPENLPAIVQNSGWEVVLNTINVRGKHITWSTSFNLTVARNKLVSYPNFASSPFASSLIVGKSLNIRKVFRCLGVDPATGIYQFADSSGKPTFTPNNPRDLTSVIDRTPRFYGGFQSNIEYKNWELSLSFTFRKELGANYLLNQPFQPGYPGYNQPVDNLNRWQKPGDKARVERFSQVYGSSVTNGYQSALTSTSAYVDASFIRLGNLSLSYQLPSTWVKRMHLQSLGFYLHCQNLLTITHFKGMDPESQNLTALPLLRIITGGIKITL